MASPIQFPLFLLLALISCSLHIHARDTQFFNKIPATTNANYLPNDQQQPSFLPENENSYGLFPPPATVNGEPATTATTLYNADSEQSPNKHLPKNYNPVSYVTESDDITDSTKFTGENYNGAQNYYNSESDYRSFPTATNNRNYYYNSGSSSFNSQPHGLSDTDDMGGATLSGRDNYFNNGNGFQQQGMSDTRFLEKGKYFYDVNAERYNINHPYERIRARNENIRRNSYGNSENGYQFNQNQYEDNYMP